MKLESIEIRNVRGKSGKIDLDQRTLLVGANASGKSAFVIGAQFAWSGKAAGEKRMDMFANASGVEMAAKIVVDGHTIERSLAQGKTLSEFITIDGQRASAGKGGTAADGMLRVAFQGKPLVFDVAEFYAAGPTEMRSRILALVSDPDTLSKVSGEIEASKIAEKEAKATLARLKAEMDALARSLAASPKPAGSLPVLKQELQGIETELGRIQSRMSLGQLNDKLQAQKDKAKAETASLVAEAKTLGAAIKVLEEERKAAVEALEAVGPEPTPPAAQMVPEDIKAQLRAFLAALQDLLGEIREADLDLPAGWMDRITAESSTLQAIADPSAACVAEYELIRSEWFARRNELAAKVTALERTYEASVRAHLRLSGQIETAKHLAAKRVGPGVNADDAAVEAGLIQRRDAVRSQVDAIEALNPIENGLEKARIAAVKAETDLEAAQKRVA
ncbi:MAG: hypothetical protein ABIH03_03410, partial [Pseudomonadota bacterium]